MRLRLACSLFLIVFAWLSVSCGSYLKLMKDPYYVNFYEKARLIMTEQEREVYKRLRDEESKKEFIEEFWRIRDPNPSTEENEARIEFDERIRYANKWFWPFSQARGPADEPDNDSGWQTDRGRMYVILGPPDLVYVGGFPYDFEAIRNRRYEQGSDEVWWYRRYQLSLYFQSRGGGEFRLLTVTSELRVAMESAKLNLVTQGLAKSSKRRFEFDVEFKNNMILIIIPVRRVDFEEENDKLVARFRVMINVYLDHKKVDEIQDTRILRENEDTFLEMSSILLEYPYQPKLKGRYVFDVIVEDELAMSFGKYRNSVKYKH